MSLAILKATKEEIFIGADSRASRIINGVLYKDNDNCEKLSLIHNKVIFSCGASELLDDILQEYAGQNKTDLYTLYTIAKSKMDKFKRDNPEFIKQLNDIYCGIIVVEYNNYFKQPLIHIISDDYDGVRSSFRKDNKESYEAFGIKTIEAKEMLNQFKNSYEQVEELFQAVYDNLSFEGIGGNLIIYSISEKGIYRFYDNPIKDSTKVKYINNCSFDLIHRIIGDRLVITEDGGDSYRVLLTSQGINLENFALTNKITIAAKPYEPNSDKICGGFRIQKNMGTYDDVKWDDVFYLDLDGNIHMKDSYIDMNSGTNQIYIDPNVGIKVKKGNEDTFYIDQNTGELYIKGNLIAGKIDIDTEVKVGDSISIGNPESEGNKTLNFENQGNPEANITKYINGELKVWCDDKITLAGYDGTSIIGQVGFFDKEPIMQQTATKLPSNATLTDVIVKVNGILGKLENYGLIKITG